MFVHLWFWGHWIQCYLQFSQRKKMNFVFWLILVLLVETEHTPLLLETVLKIYCSCISSKKNRSVVILGTKFYTFSQIQDVTAVCEYASMKIINWFQKN